MPDYDKPIEIQNAMEVPKAVERATNDAKAIIDTSDDWSIFQKAFDRTYRYPEIREPDYSAADINYQGLQSQHAQTTKIEDITGPCIVTRKNIHTLFLYAMEKNRTDIVKFLLTGKFSEKAISEINFGIDESGTHASNIFSLECLQNIHMLRNPDTKMNIFKRIIEDTCQYNMPRQKILQDHKDPASYIQSIKDNIARVKEIAEKIIDAVNSAKDLSDEQKEKLKNEVAIQTQKTLDSNNQKLAETKTQHTASQSTQQPTATRTEHETEQTRARPSSTKKVTWHANVKTHDGGKKSDEFYPAKKLNNASCALQAVEKKYQENPPASEKEKLKMRIEILEKQLEYRKTLYEIRDKNGQAHTGFQFFRSEHTSAKAKLAATDAMLQQLRNLKSPLKRPQASTDLTEAIQSGSQQYNAEKYKIAFAPRIDEKTAAQGELGKLYRTFLDIKKEFMAINNAPDLTPKPK